MDRDLRTKNVPLNSKYVTVEQSDKKKRGKKCHRKKKRKNVTKKVLKKGHFKNKNYRENIHGDGESEKDGVKLYQK